MCVQVCKTIENKESLCQYKILKIVFLKAYWNNTFFITRLVGTEKNTFIIKLAAPRGVMKNGEDET